MKSENRLVEVKWTYVLIEEDRSKGDTEGNKESVEYFKK